MDLRSNRDCLESNIYENLRRRLSIYQHFSEVLSLLIRKTWGNIYKEDHRRSPSGAASAFYPGRLVLLASVRALRTWDALLPEVRLAFHRGRPSNSASHLERAVCLSSPARSVLRRLTFPHSCRGVLCFVSFLSMMDPFKVQSFLSGEGKWEILDNWKGACSKETNFICHLNISSVLEVQIQKGTILSTFLETVHYRRKHMIHDI